MDINKNLEKLNAYLCNRRICISDKLYIIDLAKASKDIDDLKDNINWEMII